MTPLIKYHLDVQNQGFQPDPSQAIVVEFLEKLYQTLTQPWSLWRLFQFKKKPQGAYLYGPVGAGKTYLMDTFYHCLPFKAKKRRHFHEFMQEVHQQLAALQGTVDPLKKLAKTLRREARVLCFDEFWVKDIADAMLLGRLFKALFAEGIVLVATSNIPLEQLYQNGLQRERFLPTIALLKEHLIAFPVGNQQDYRLLGNPKIEQHYFSSLSEETEIRLQEAFCFYSCQEKGSTEPLIFNHRLFHPKQWAEDTIWFDFEELCIKPRNAADYLAIVKEFKTIIISDIPVLTDDDPDAVMRFISLIDVLYDEKIRWIISSTVYIEEVYKGYSLKIEFGRAKSRLLQRY